VKPIRVEKIKIKDYADFFRKATKKEREKWWTRHGEEIEKIRKGSHLG